MSEDYIGSIIINLLSSGLFKAGEEAHVFFKERYLKRVFRVRNAKKNELKIMHSILAKFTLQENLATLKKIEELYSWSQNSYKVIEVYNLKLKKYEDISGFFIIHKLKKKFSKKIMGGTKNILDLSESDIHKDKTASYGYYVSFVYAKSKIEKGQLMQAINSYIYSGFKKSNEQYIITRPGPIEAVKFCQNNNMFGVNGCSVMPHEICYRALPSENTQEYKKINKAIMKYKLHSNIK